MALVAQTLMRRFRYNGITLADPAPEKSVDQIRVLFSYQYPELLNSTVEGPVTKDGVCTYTFLRAVGSKGVTQMQAIKALACGELRMDCKSPLQKQTRETIEEAIKCSQLVKALVCNHKVSVPLTAPASTFSRFG